MGFFPRVRVPGTPIRVYPGVKPKRVAKRVVKYQAAKQGLYASPWRAAPRPARKAFFTGRFLRALFRWR